MALNKGPHNPIHVQDAGGNDVVPPHGSASSEDRLPPTITPSSQEPQWLVPLLEQLNGSWAEDLANVVKRLNEMHASRMAEFTSQVIAALNSSSGVETNVQVPGAATTSNTTMSAGCSQGNNVPAAFATGAKVLAHYDKELYEATVESVEYKDGEWKYLIHYPGWHSTWDEWVNDERLLKWNEDKLSTQQLQKQQKKTSYRGKASSTGSDDKAIPPLADMALNKGPHNPIHVQDAAGNDVVPPHGSASSEDRLPPTITPSSQEPQWLVPLLEQLNGSWAEDLANVVKRLNEMHASRMAEFTSQVIAALNSSSGVETNVQVPGAATTSNTTMSAGCSQGNNVPAAFATGAKVLAHYDKELYEATVESVEYKDGEWKYLIHYPGWHSTWDEWVNDERLLKWNEDKLSTQQLQKQQKKTSYRGKASSTGSDDKAIPPLADMALNKGPHNPIHVQDAAGNDVVPPHGSASSEDRLPPTITPSSQEPQWLVPLLEQLNGSWAEDLANVVKRLNEMHASRMAEFTSQVIAALNSSSGVETNVQVPGAATTSNTTMSAGCSQGNNVPAAFATGAKVLAHYDKELYEATVESVEYKDGEWKYLIHYPGWHSTWDEWVNDERLLKWNEDKLSTQQLQNHIYCFRWDEWVNDERLLKWNEDKLSTQQLQKQQKKTSYRGKASSTGSDDKAIPPFADMALNKGPHNPIHVQDAAGNDVVPPHGSTSSEDRLPPTITPSSQEPQWLVPLLEQLNGSWAEDFANVVKRLNEMHASRMAEFTSQVIAALNSSSGVETNVQVPGAATTSNTTMSAGCSQGNNVPAAFATGAKVLTHYDKELYEATGWHNTWDEWVNDERLLKWNEDKLSTQQLQNHIYCFRWDEWVNDERLLKWNEDKLSTQQLQKQQKKTSYRGKASSTGSDDKAIPPLADMALNKGPHNPIHVQDASGNDVVPPHGSASSEDRLPPTITPSSQAIPPLADMALNKGPHNPIHVQDASGNDVVPPHGSASSEDRLPPTITPSSQEPQWLVPLLEQLNGSWAEDLANVVKRLNEMHASRMAEFTSQVIAALNSSSGVETNVQVPGAATTSNTTMSAGCSQGNNVPAAFATGAKVLAHYDKELYEATVESVEYKDGEWKYLIHYPGWHSTWDEWVNDERLLKWNEDKLSTQQLQKQQKKTSYRGKASSTGSDDKGEQKVCVIYDKRMLSHIPPSDSFHVEEPDRVSSIYESLEADRLLERCVVYEALMPDMVHLEAVHAKAHINRVLNFKSSKSHTDMYSSEGTPTAIKIAAGGVIRACELLAQRCHWTGFAIVRPPGHHATWNKYCGFCFINNIAVGAQYLIKNHGFKRILIVDWDIHHGNGTESIFKKSNHVFCFSLHRYDENFYPCAGEESNVGSGEGKGYTGNICWRDENVYDDDFFAVWECLLMPLVEELKPEIILFSCGFDAALGDPVGRCSVSPQGFATLLSKLNEFSLKLGIGLLLVLEGGYDKEALKKSSSACVEVLAGKCDILEYGKYRPLQSTIDTIELLKEHLAQYWTSLQQEIPAEVLKRVKLPDDDVKRWVAREEK